MKEAFFPLKVSEVMTREVVSIDESVGVIEAAKLMSIKNIGSVVVKKDNKVVGILTERDFLDKIVAKGLDPSALRVIDIMSAPAIACTSDTPITAAVRVMRERKIRHLPIVDEGKLVGIVAGRDLTALGWRVIVY